MVGSDSLFGPWIPVFCCGTFFGILRSIILVHVLSSGFRLLFAFATLAARPWFRGTLVSSFWIRLEIVDPFAVAIGVRGLACCRINVCQESHVSVLLVGLASGSSGSFCYFSMLLAPAGSGTTATASASALTSMLEHHGDHVVGSSCLLISGRIFPLAVVVVVTFVVVILLVGR